MSTRVEISKRLVLINSASSVVARLIDISVLVWLQQYLLRRITPEEYSLYPVLMSVMMFAPLLTTIFTSGLGRYIVESYAKGDEQGVTQITSTMFPLLLAAGVLMLCFGWVFAWHIGHILTIPPERLRDAQLMMGLLMFSAAIRLPLSPFGVGLYVHQKFILSNCIGLGIAFLRVALLFVLLFGVSTRVLWVIVASVSAELVSLVVNISISIRLLPALKFRLNKIRWAMAKPLVSFGGWSFIGQIANTIRTAADAIILNKLATPFDVTCFHLGALPYREIERGTALLLGPLQPALIAMHATDSKERLKNAYLRGGRYALWAACFFAIPAILYRRELITLYVGQKYLPAATVMALLLVTFPIAFGNLMMYYVAHATAQIGLPTRRAIFVHLANLFLTIYLVGFRHMGAVGSALGTLLAGLIGSPLLIYPVGLRLASVSFRTLMWETLLPGLLPTLICGAVLIWLRLLARPDTWFQVGTCVLMGCIVYSAILLGFCLRAQDRRDLTILIQKIKSAL
jgi:O-antigen/teichoic acid export membrane protein